MSHLLDLWPGPWTCNRCDRNPTWSGPAPPECCDLGAGHTSPLGCGISPAMPPLLLRADERYIE